MLPDAAEEAHMVSLFAIPYLPREFYIRCLKYCEKYSDL